MIHEIFSDLPTFKRLTLRSGLNVLLADKSPGASDLQTRNGAGKSSLIEIVHFLLGSKAGPDSVFRKQQLESASFGMRFDLGVGQAVTVRRTGSRPSQIDVQGDFSKWTIAPRTVRGTDRTQVSNEEWKAILGGLIFGLRDSDGEGKFGPSFRSLVSYFARRERNSGFASAFAHFGRQANWDQQVSLSYLFGLDWSIAQSWQHLREKENELHMLKRAMAEGAFGAMIEPVPELRANLAVAEEKTRRARTALGEFRVLEQYHALEEEASKLTRELNALSDHDTVDTRYLSELEAATHAEAPAAVVELEQLWREAGVVLPENVRKRYEDLQQFHESVIRNRRSYLQTEIEQTKSRIAARAAQRAELDHRRSEIMSTLRSHGALEHFTSLQLELARLESQTEHLRQKYKSADALQQGQVRLIAQRAGLLTRLQEDHHEQRQTLDRAAVVFSQISSLLYEEGGQLLIGAEENGPSFDIRIHAEQSRGISNMQVFCFDLTLIQLCLERGLGPRFLIHDSHLFDGVDERQVGKALAVGARLSKQLGFQYLVTMNSDAKPRELPAGFELDEYVLPVRLTDASDTGGLFGVRFE